MALEVLHGVKEIGGFKVCDLDAIKDDPNFKQGNGYFDWLKYDEFLRIAPIVITHSDRTISFRIQNGPIKENGVNGCQVDTLIETALLIIQGLNEKFPCEENKKAVEDLKSALGWLNLRKINREARGVEGKNEL